VKSFRAEDGERLTVVWWKDRETLEQWRTDSRHLSAKQTGRERWYEYYNMEVAEVYRESKFERAKP
jgi:heme-degrading monooxygenase HmoA